MRRFTLTGLLSFAAVLALSLPVRAQQAGGADNPMMAQMQKFRDDHKNTFALMQFFEGMIALETTDAAKLTPKQAKQILDLLTPITKKPKLTADEARGLHKKLQAVLTAKQVTHMTKMQAQKQQGGRQGGAMMGGGPGGGGPGGGGPPPGGGGGAGPGGGGVMQFDMNSLKNFNPYYLPKKEERAKLPRWTLQRVERFEGQLKQLKDKATKA